MPFVRQQRVEGCFNLVTILSVDLDFLVTLFRAYLKKFCLYIVYNFGLSNIITRRVPIINFFSGLVQSIH